MNDPYSIDKEFLVLDPEKQATIEPSDSSLFERIVKKYNGFKGCELISCYKFSSDWSTWEIHPNGEEIVILLSGEVMFTLQLEAGDKSIVLNRPASYAIVTKNTWHTAKTNVSTKMLFITPGEGTQHKDV